jgi:hypothetical protein|tara:strand:- start:26 stop:250 length:225 start_codon:yes stop_codon:yes gene_type:complete
MSTNSEKTAYEWAKEFGIQILDPDGFGERSEGSPDMDELMNINTFNKCMTQSTIRVKDKNLWRNRNKTQRVNHE